MPLFRRGARGPAVQHLRLQLADLELLPAGAAGASDVFDDEVELAVRRLQQSRGLVVDGVVGPHTAEALQEARQRLGERLLYRSISQPVHR